MLLAVVLAAAFLGVSAESFDASAFDVKPFKVVTVGTKHYIGCDASASDTCGDATIGHTRADCISGLQVRNELTDVIVTLPTVCACYQNFYLEHDENDGRNCTRYSNEARCMYVHCSQRAQVSSPLLGHVILS